MHRFVLAAAVLALAPSTAASDCMPVQLTAQVITLTDAAIPSDGGILVATTVAAKYDPADKGKSANPVRPKWRMGLDGSKTVPVIDVLAPGLAVYRIPTTPNSIPVTLEDEDQKIVAKVTTSKAKPAVYAAPKLEKLEYIATMTRHSMQRIEATLESDPPKDTYAIVIADAKGKPKSWGTTGKGTTQYPYMHSDCGSVPNGTSIPQPGDMVTVFYVDSQGRRSESSKPIKLGGKPSPY